MNKKAHLITLILLILFSVTLPNSPKAQEVNIGGNLYSCIFSLTSRPEKRIPAVNNWDATLNVRIYPANSGIVSANFQENSDIYGTININLCDNGYQFQMGFYDFYIRGHAHLVKAFKNIESFVMYESSVDFSQPNNFLFAGETSIVYDNYINALDFSTQIESMFTSDYGNDLNQDGIVNSLDLSNTIHNIYYCGDLLPGNSTELYDQNKCRNI